MKLYVACVTFEGKIEIVKSEYNRKQDFYIDLRGNGYKVRFISTEENFDADCEKYHERCEMNRIRNNARYRATAQFAKEMKMTVKEFKAWQKACK